MNNDRGVIKWTAMMLPEHVKLLREWQVEDTLTEKPELDEAQLEQINRNLQQAYTAHCPIRLHIWAPTGNFTVTSTIQKIMLQEQAIKLADGGKIYFHHICEAVLEE